MFSFGAKSGKRDDVKKSSAGKNGLDAEYLTPIHRNTKIQKYLMHAIPDQPLNQLPVKRNYSMPQLYFENESIFVLPELIVQYNKPFILAHTRTFSLRLLIIPSISRLILSHPACHETPLTTPSLPRISPTGGTRLQSLTPPFQSAIRPCLTSTTTTRTSSP